MALMPLADLLAAHHNELLERCGHKAQVSNPALDPRHTRGIGAFIDQVIEALQQTASSPDSRTRSVAHGGDLYAQGSTLADVVRDYENACQAVTDLAGEHKVAIAVTDLRTIDRCLDDTISAAVASYAARLRKDNRGRVSNVLPLVDGVIAAFDVLQGGRIGSDGSTGELVRLSLQCIRAELEAFPDHAAAAPHAEPALAVEPAAKKKRTRTANVTPSMPETPPATHH